MCKINEKHALVFYRKECIKHILLLNNMDVFKSKFLIKYSLITYFNWGIRENKCIFKLEIL